MSIRHLLILFFSVLAASLVVLILFFSLFFDKVDLTFNTHIPDTAPTMQWKAPDGSTSTSPDGGKITPFKTDSETTASTPGVGFTSQEKGYWPKSALVNVPGEAIGPVLAPNVASLGEPSVLPSTATSEMVEGSEASSEPPAQEPEQKALASEKSNEKTKPPHQVQGGAFPFRPDEIINKPLLPFTNKRKEKEKETEPTPSQPKALDLPSPKPLASKVEAVKSVIKKALPQPTPANGGTYRVYVGGFSSPGEASVAKARYEAQGLKPIIRSVNGKPVLQIGVYNNATAARSIADQTGAAVQSE